MLERSEELLQQALCRVFKICAFPVVPFRSWIEIEGERPLPFSSLEERRFLEPKKISFYLLESNGKTKLDSEKLFLPFLFWITAFFSSFSHHAEFFSVLTQFPFPNPKLFPFSELACLDELWQGVHRKKREAVFSFFSSTSLLLPCSCVHLMIANQLELFCDELQGKDPSSFPKQLFSFFLSSKKFFSFSDALFLGDRWELWLDRKTERLFAPIWSEEELRHRYRVELENKVLSQEKALDQLLSMESANPLFQELKILREQLKGLGPEAKNTIFRDLIEPKIRTLSS